MDATLVRVPAWLAASLPTRAEAVSDAIEQARATPGHILELEEAWAGVHFVLTSEVPIPRHEALRRGISWDDDSRENALMGGLPTPHAAGPAPYGTTRYLPPAQAARMTERLGEVSPAQFAERYDAEALEEERIPPPGWESAERRAWLAGHFAGLVDFCRAAAAAGDGILISMH